MISVGHNVVWPALSHTEDGRPISFPKKADRNGDVTFNNLQAEVTQIRRRREWQLVLIVDVERSRNNESLKDL